MKKTQCMTYFAIKGQFQLNEISQILNLKNTGGHSIGDIIGRGPGVCQFALWEYGTAYEETLDSEEQIERVLTPLMLKIDELKYIKNNYDCRFVLEQVQNIYENQKPGIFYNTDSIKFCAKTDTVIDVDIYILN